MGRPAQSLLAPALGMIAALALASCGGNDAQLLPGGTARDITANLDTVRQLADEGDCVGAESAAQQVSEQVEALGGIDAKLKRALEEGAARLNEVVAGCDESTTEESTPTTAPTEAESTEGKPAKKKEGKEKQREEAPKEEETAPTTTETQPSEPSPPSQPESEEGSSGGVGPGTPVEGEG
jgi:septal ring-binding cell division protein DamX